MAVCTCASSTYCHVVRHQRHKYNCIDDLKSKLKEAGTSLVVIDFFAVWCGPCKMIGPLIEELSKEMQDVIFLKVDVDECEDIAAEYEITSMPTFIFIKEGKVLETFSGANYDKLKNTVEKHK
ncbi:thioredoxin-2-like isoform X2 [Cataglyphis hispanica]|uniref:thioredoxin-2-like isoform X2 n=1 Tax=Cataglyphis hispanica TaxID=1086592 RepID=UPI00217F5972|nr:thioredoxin-2-like isoform X2 [Cataglyphis hispanica]